MPRVFLSSTFKDLQAHRRAVLDAFRNVDDLYVDAMEDWTARPNQPVDECIRMAEKADVFVALVGQLYGFIPKNEERSITQMEYEAAQAKGIPILAFVAGEDFPVTKKQLKEDSDPDKQDDFRARVLNEQTADLTWETPDQLAGRVVTAVANTLRELGIEAADLPTAPLDLRAYRQRCRETWGSLDLTTVSAPGAVGDDTRTPTLTDLFIPQDCRRSRPAVSLSRDYLEEQGLDPDEEERILDQIRQRWEREERLPVLDLLCRNEARRTVLLGDPGAGKSSLTSFLLLQLLDAYITQDEPTDWRAPLAGRFPLLIELRDLAAREKENRYTGLLGYLDYMAERGFWPSGDSIRQFLETEPSFLLIDGLDEIFDPIRRKAMVQEILGLSARFPNARIVVTSRIAGFEAHPFEAATFKIATLDDLSPEQVEDYVSRWFALAFPGDERRAEEKETDLLETLSRRPQLKVIAGNPLLLTIMAIVARHAQLSRSRAKLYEQALEVLCYAWDFQRGLRQPETSPLKDLQKDDTLMMLRRIAWAMQENAKGLRANAIREMDLKAVLESYFEDEWGYDAPTRRRAASEMLELLQNRNWILTLRGPGLFGFVHRTFLEYLCALDLAERFRQQEVTAAEVVEVASARFGQDAWQEIARLLCGELPSVAEALIRAALSRGDDEGLVLAWQFIGEVEPRTLRTLTPLCAHLTQALYRYHDSHRETWGHEPHRDTDLIEALSAIEPEHWPGAGLGEMGWPTPQRKRSDRVAVAIIASLWSQRDNTYSLVRSAAQINDDSNVRRTAINTLGSAFADREGAFEAVRGWAQDDDDSIVRGTAINTLGKLVGTQTDRRLLSQDLDGIGPWLDPHASITEERVQSAATKLALSQEEVSAAYERMVDDLCIPLRLVWRK